MIIPLSLKEAQKRHLKQVNELLQILRKSQSKNRNSPLEDMLWEYRSAKYAQPIDMRKFLKGEVSSEKESLQEEVEATHVFLHAKIGHWQAGVQLASLPPIIIFHLENKHKKILSEKEKFDSLSTTEQQANLSKILRSLGMK